MSISTEPIPGPPALPILGNILNIDPADTIASFQKLQEQYGDIYRLRLGPGSLIIASTHALMDEVSDEKRFKKIPNNVLKEIRHGVHDGLFTAHLEEPSWGIAHRVLMPAFGPLAIRNMYDEMHDVASQLVLKWARHGPHREIMLTDDYTRLTLDTIALCSMGYRFNSYYSETMHPFIEAMGAFLVESGRRGQRIPAPAIFYRDANRKFAENIAVMREVADSVLQERAADPDNQRKDLLTAMLKGQDNVTGQKISHESIIDNLITFLIAGHETTSGMLSYATYQLMKHPDEYRKVQQEVDEVIGKGPVKVEHMAKLPYITAVLRESLRLDATIPIFSVYPTEDTIIGGKYHVKQDDNILCLLSKAHVDPLVFEEPLRFKPERMLEENFRKLPKNCWKPFGNGVRACIGRPFAEQEAILAMAMIFQNFDLELADPDYKLKHKQTLTIKPDNLYIRAKLRHGLTPTALEDRISRTSSPRKTASAAPQRVPAKSVQDNAGMKLTVLYGSNSSTCESMAQQLTSDAPANGFNVVRVCAMDEAVNALPKDDPKHIVIVVTASYEGEPPDNAAKFVSWIEKAQNDTSILRGTRYAVFGCGNRNWVQTFHRIPLLVDRRLEELGGNRVAEIGLADAAGDDMFMTFESWEDETLWPSLEKIRISEGGTPTESKDLFSQTLKAHLSDKSIAVPRRGLEETKVVNVETLTTGGESIKKRIDIQIPAGSTYRAGDYIAVLPSNPKASVLRALRRFNLPWDAIISLEGSSLTLPTNISTYARTVLSDFVELGQPVTKKGIHRLAESTKSEDDANEVKRLAEPETYSAEIAEKRISMLDLLEKYPSIDLELGTFLSLLPPLRVRQYSISSSPLASPSVATITYSVLTEQAKSGQGIYRGVASSYLSILQTDDPIYVAIKPSHAHFHLPTDAKNEPVIMVAAGTGIAPFRGFIQERAELIGKKRCKLAPAVLYYGCRHIGVDDLYADELAAWEKTGAVVVKRAYSREPDFDYKYVQDALWADREQVQSLWQKNAKIYVCGSRALSDGVDEMLLRVLQQAAEIMGEQEKDEAAMKDWWKGLRNVRYVADVFD